MSGTRRPTEPISILVDQAGLDLLQKHAFPCSEDVLASATPTKYGIELTGTWVDMDMFVGFVAGEANYARKKNRTRQCRILDEIADSLEAALTPVGFF